MGDARHKRGGGWPPLTPCAMEIGEGVGMRGNSSLETEDLTEVHRSPLVDARCSSSPDPANLIVTYLTR